MNNRRDQLIQLTNDFVDAFNRMNLEDVVSFFADDGIYEDSTGGRHIGRDAIRTAFEPLELARMCETSCQPRRYVCR